MTDSQGYEAIAEAESEAAGSGARDRWLKRWRWPLIAAGPLVIAVGAAYFAFAAGRYEVTDNAYVQIAKAPVSASIGGRVVEVLVAENQVVRAGQPLFRLDPRNSTADAAQAHAELAQTEWQIRALRATYQQQATNVAAARATVRFREREAKRLEALVAAGVSSRQEADEAQHDLDLARQELTAARQQVASTLASLGGSPGGPLSAHPAVAAAQARLERAQLTQSYTVVLAPTGGVVTRVEQLQPGAYVEPAQTVFWLLRGTPWIEANFKENQLAHMKVGQPVDIDIDALPKGRLKGRVASFSPGTGAVFSALPAQNATGNWVKVAQRLPVRVAFDGSIPVAAQRAGLSAHVRVHVRAGGS